MFKQRLIVEQTQMSKLHQSLVWTGSNYQSLIDICSLTARSEAIRKKKKKITLYVCIDKCVFAWFFQVHCRIILCNVPSQCVQKYCSSRSSELNKEIKKEVEGAATADIVQRYGAQYGH